MLDVGREGREVWLHSGRQWVELGQEEVGERRWRM